MNVKESLVDGGMVQFQFQLKASTGQLPSPPGCKPASEDPGLKELEILIAVKVLTTVKICFLLFRSLSAVACFSSFRDVLIICPHLQRLRRQCSNRFDRIKL